MSLKADNPRAGAPSQVLHLFQGHALNQHRAEAVPDSEPFIAAIPPAFDPQGRTFTGFLHSESTLRSTGVVKPHNPDTFILVIPGKDGLYGTDDDLANFNTGG